MFNIEHEIKKETAAYFERKGAAMKPEETLALAASIPLLSSRSYVTASHEERAAMTKRYMEACDEIQRMAVALQRKREAE